MHKMGRYLLILSFLLVPQLLAGTTYYIATNGNDSYNGLYPSYQSGSNGPFRTLGKAAATVRAGDTVQIRGGTYREASTWSTDGTAANPITITNYASETVTIDGNNWTIPGGPTGNLVAIIGDWYEISNLSVTKSSGYGINAYTAKNCVISNIYAYQNWSWGIIGGSYCTISNCRAHNNSLMNEYGAMPQGGWGGGITICRNGNTHTTVRGCTAWDNWGEGISTFETYYITIEDCVSYNNMHNFYLSDTQYALFQRNLSYYTPGNIMQGYYTQCGIKLEDETNRPSSSDITVINNLSLGGERNLVAGGTGSELVNCLIAHNTFVNAAGTQGYESACVYFHRGAATNSQFRNNIILQEDDVDISHLEATGISFGYNNWSKVPLSGCQGTGDLIALPLLAKTGPTGPGSLTPTYFKILESSPARGMAQVLADVTQDFFKSPRGSDPDIGAHEFSYGTSALTASATGSPTTGQAPLTVSFDGSASGGTSPYSYRWTFGDGSSSTSQDPLHTYSSSGSYTATLTVTDSRSATDTATMNINVTTSVPLSASISASPTSGQAPVTVNFSGTASGGASPYSYRWTFGDGGSSNAQNPSHTYSSPGTYSATFTVTDSQSASSSKSLTITATAAPSQLVATATANPTSGQAPLAVYFTGSASGGASPYSYSWTFGDGGSSTAQNPSHTYSVGGTYTATLTVTDSSSANAGATASITVGTVVTAASLALAAETGAPAPGQGGTTEPSPGNYTFSIGSTVSLESVPYPDYRFSKWGGDIPQSSMFNPTPNLLMNNNKSLLATFCTKCGDVNGDLAITPADAQMAFDIYLKKIPDPTWCEWENSDVNSSGTKLNPKVTPADAQTLFNKYLKKVTVNSTCSGSSRAATVSMQNVTGPAVKLAVNSSAFNQDGYLYVPILIESPSEVGAFGFDLAFPSDQLTYVGLERTELTADFDQLDSNVIPFPLSPEQSVVNAFSPFGVLPICGGGSEPAEGFDQRTDNASAGLFLRVGGYKSSAAESPSSGVLITLVFRVIGHVSDPSSISIIATYDDIQNASIIGGAPKADMAREERPVGRYALDKRSSGKRYDF